MPKESMTRSAGPPSATGARPRSASRPSHEPPWGLGNSTTRLRPGEPPRRRETLDGVDGLCDERLGLGAERLLGHDGFADELRQAA